VHKPKQTLNMLTQSLAEAMAKRFDDFTASGDRAQLGERLAELVQVEDYFARGHLTPDARDVALQLIARAHDWLREQNLKDEYDRVQAAAKRE